MKLISIFCVLLLSIAFSSASTNVCKYGEISYTLNNVCSCIPYYSCHYVSLSQNVITSYQSNGETFTQYSVDITNHVGINIKNIVIGTDATLNLRDSSSLWGMQKLSNGDLILPTVQPSINKDASYTFGFILKGNTRANLYIKAVVY
ncbi:hypothetical protein RB653_001450 [Dictyostelium firmibasis]|uniref:Carbohydrate binding domain-containing protein n=1 Tax=Dictyostelium firmibasis TaxID=79012 RepID=A0AAN7UGQ1_9MYCE